MSALISNATQLFSSASMASTLTSNIIDMRGANGAFIDFAWSSGSSLDGTIEVWASSNGVIWNQLYSGSVSGVSGSGSVEYPNGNAGFFYLKWNRSAGTGTLNAYANLKWTN